MRIIRVLVIAGLLLAIIGQNKAFAMKQESTNETKINLKKEEKSTLINIIGSIIRDTWSSDSFRSSVIIVEPELPVVEAEKAVEIPEETEREKILSRFQDRLDKAILPEGQFEINASAYTAAADECGKSDGITASGVMVKENRTLACPPQFPLGAKIKIDGLGTYVCEDRGGAIKGNHFDIYMQTKKEAFAFGRRILLAEVVR